MDPVAQLQHTNKLKFTWGLICLIGPSALIVLTIVIYAVSNAIVGASDSGGSMFGSASVVTTIVNIILYLVGAISILTWLPGIIVGIILLATRK